MTTVAAGTHNRDGQRLGHARQRRDVHRRVASRRAVGPEPFIDSTAAGLAGADPARCALCFAAVDNGGTPVLDPAKVAGKIVVCDRGVNARVDKSLAVKQAGGVGMILANTSPNSLNADFHFVPTVHVSNADRAAIKAYAATAGATATINASTIVFDAPAPFTAAFSSRGPLLAGGGDLLKPDVIAPGQDILAAVAPPGNAGRDFNLLSGTSMSSPHVAGLAALLMHLHPDWSPMAIKSALMTTAYDVLDGPNTNPLRDLPAGRRPRAAEQGGRSGPRLRHRLQRLAGVPVRHDDGVSTRPSCTALQAAGFSTRRERPERRVDRDRRPRRHPDRQADGDERRQRRGDLHRRR